MLDLYQRAMASTRRILDLLDVAPRIVDGPRELPRQDVRGEVRFDSVRFAYGAGSLVLDGLDLPCPVGRTTAIVGATGAGKSTIVKLLLRLYEDDRPDAGRIGLDGLDVRELRLADLRRSIALVSQDVYLFDGTVRENIAYGGDAQRSTA